MGAFLIFLSSCSGFVPISLIKQQPLRRALLKASSTAFLCLLQPHPDRPVVLSFTQSLEPRLLRNTRFGFYVPPLPLLLLRSPPPPPRFFWLLFFLSSRTRKKTKWLSESVISFFAYFSLFGSHFPPHTLSVMYCPSHPGHCVV